MEEPRDSAMLTTSNRDFLRDRDPDMTDRGVRKAKARIRARVRNSILDGNLLWECLEEDQYPAIFSEFERYANIPEDGELEHNQESYWENHVKNESHEQWVGKNNLLDGIISWVAFFYLGVESTPWEFEEVLELAVNQVENSRWRELEEFSFEAVTREKPSPEKLKREFDNRERLSTEEIKMLIEAEIINNSDINEYFATYEINKSAEEE